MQAACSVLIHLSPIADKAAVKRSVLVTEVIILLLFQEKYLHFATRPPSARLRSWFMLHLSISAMKTMVIKDAKTPRVKIEDCKGTRLLTLHSLRNFENEPLSNFSKLFPWSPPYTRIPLNDTK